MVHRTTRPRSGSPRPRGAQGGTSGSPRGLRGRLRRTDRRRLGVRLLGRVLPGALVAGVLLVGQSAVSGAWYTPPPWPLALALAVTATLLGFAATRDPAPRHAPVPERPAAAPWAQYVTTFTELVRLLRERVGPPVQRDGHPGVPLDGLVTAALVHGYWTERDAQRWSGALDLRNRIVDGVEPEREQLRAATKDIARLRRALGKPHVARSRRLVVAREGVSLAWRDRPQEQPAEPRLKLVGRS